MVTSKNTECRFSLKVQLIERGLPLDDSDNCYHVVSKLSGYLGAQTVLDGFVITGGNADNSYGPGIHLRYGGGVLIYIPSQAILRNLIITGNSAHSGGGLGIVDLNGLATNPKSTSVINCRITNNYGQSRGGGVFMYKNWANFVNTSFVNNNVANTSGAPARGGGLHVIDGFIRLYNCTFQFNHSLNTGADIFFSFVDSSRIYNTIIENVISIDKKNSSNHINHHVKNCLLHHYIFGSVNRAPLATDLGGNIDTLPHFYAYNIPRIKYDSPARNAGSDTLLPIDIWDLDDDGDTTEYLPIDARDFVRIYDGQVDMGAFEYIPARIDSFTQGICTWDSVLFDGQHLDSAGNYTAVVKSNSNGDTLSHLTLSIHPVHGNVYYDSNTVIIVALQDSASYQWYQCGTDSLLAGDSSAVFEPAVNGSYYAIITNSAGCSDTSQCVDVNIIGSTSHLTPNEVGVFPNPAKQLVRVSVKAMKVDNQALTLKLISVEGAVVQDYDIPMDANEYIDVDVSQLDEGLYFLELNGYVGKLLIQR